MTKKFLFLSIFIFFYPHFYKCHSRENNIPYLSIAGVIKTDDGIGKIAPELAIALSADINLELVSTRSLKLKNIPSSILGILSNKKKPKGNIVFFTDNLTPYGDRMYKKLFPKRPSDQIHIAYSMLESTAIPQEWTQILNNNFDAVAVPDVFLIDVYRNSGVRIPIFELPLGLNLAPFLNLPIKEKVNQPLVFGCLGSAIDRKNILLLIRAFIEAFGVNNSSVSLIINSRYGDNETISKIRQEIECLGSTNISFETTCVSFDDYLKLHQKIDVYVSLSKGEGFSFQPREAMALGTPVIVTDNSAQSTICKSNLVRAVSSKIEEPAVYSYNGGVIHGTNFNCSIEEAKDALLDVYNNYDKYLKKSMAMRKWAEQYDYKNQKNVFKNFFLPKVLVLGDENKITSEFLMTTSTELFSKWQKILNKKKTNLTKKY